MDLQKQKTMKLSEKQKEVIRLLRDGWFLGYVDSVIYKSATLYKGSIENWEQVIFIRYTTLKILLEKKLVKQVGKYFTIKKYPLTEKGKTINL